MDFAPQLLVAIPCHNEARFIAPVIQATRRLTPHVWVIDDGSIDGTASVAEGAGARVWRHPQNMGYGRALRSAFQVFLDSPQEVLVTLDGDGQHLPEELPELLTPILDGQAELVIGNRFLGRPSNVPRYRRFGTCAARLDDLLNFVPARLSAFVLVPLAAFLTGCNGFRALDVALRDRLKHASPNSAHGEAAFAGALQVQLGGSATYRGVASHKPLLNAGARVPEPADISRAISLSYAVTLVGLCLALAGLWAAGALYR